jgi:hypothetical protein
VKPAQKETDGHVRVLLETLQINGIDQRLSDLSATAPNVGTHLTKSERQSPKRPEISPGRFYFST